MKKKVTLKRIFHNDQWRYGIYFDYDPGINSVVKALPVVTYSGTNKCWHVSADESTLKMILSSLRDIADVDISAISLPSEKRKGCEESSFGDNHVQVKEFYNEVPEQTTDASTDTGRKGRYGPVSFSVHEQYSRLIIKFLGRYDPDWISEMKTYGKIYYDKFRKEWSLGWSQMTVDSLADYFMSMGVEVKVIKQRLPDVIREQRLESGTGIRERFLNDEAMKGLELLKRHLEESRYSSKTVEAYISMLELFFKFYYLKVPSEITERDISDFFHDFVFANDYSPSYQSQMVSAIKLYYYLNGNDILNIMNLRRPRCGRSLPKVFSKEEVSRILNSPSNPKHKLILWIIYSCGLRRNEVTNIRLRDLDRDRSVLNIVEAKGMVDRVVPVPAKVWARIDDYIKSHRPVIYLFEGQTGGRYSSESVYRVFKDALKKAGINKEVGVHSLRHSYATHLHENGLDIKYIQELLGHKDSRTTEIYTHVSRRNLMVVRSPIEDLDVS